MEKLIMNFNYDHYMNVRRARKKEDLHMFSDIHPNNGEMPNHPLVGAKITNHYKTYHIQSVHRHWHHGWYIALQCYSWYESNETMGSKFENGKWWGKSHTMLFWENESCVDTIVLKSIKENKKMYKLI